MIDHQKIVIFTILFFVPSYLHAHTTTTSSTSTLDNHSASVAVATTTTIGIQACYSPTTFSRYTYCNISRIESSLDFVWSPNSLPFGTGIPWSATFSGMLNPSINDNYTFMVQTDSVHSFTTVRIDDHPIIVSTGPDHSPGGSGNQTGYYPVPIPSYTNYNSSGYQGAKFIIEYTWNPYILNVTSTERNKEGGPSPGPSFWRLLITGPQYPEPTSIPSAWLSPSLPPWENSYLMAKEQEENGKNSFSSTTVTAPNAWGSYYSNDLLTLSRIPDGLSLKYTITVGNQTLSNLGAKGPLCTGNDNAYWPEGTRLGVHGTGVNRSLYAQMEAVVWQNYEWNVEYVALNNGTDTAVIMTLVSSPSLSVSSVSSAYLTLNLYIPPEWLPRWCNITSVSTTTTKDPLSPVPALSAVCPGINGSTTLQFASDTVSSLLTVNTTANTITFGPVPSQPNTRIAFYTGNISYSTAELVSIASSSRTLLLLSYGTYGDDNETIAGLSSAIGWNTIFAPLEGLLAPVFRGNPWGLSPRGYVMFLWDTFLASYLALVATDPWIAIANTVRLIKSMTPDQCLNGHWEGTCGELNSKPPLGTGAIVAITKTTIAMSNSTTIATWLVPTVFEHLLFFNRWWWKERMVTVTVDNNVTNSSVLLIAPGSHTLGNPAYGCSTQNYDGKQGAKFETGLDNSPVFDSASWIPSTSTIDSVDVGLSAMYARDGQLLAELASNGYLPSTAETQKWIEELTDRWNSTAYALDFAAWSTEDTLWLNRFWTGMNSSEFVRIPTPPSFYPLLLGVTSVERVEQALGRWLTNASEFCVTDTSEKCTNSSLPSVTRSQSSSFDNNYWRGRAWGPMTFLTYSSLMQYRTVSTLVNETMQVMGEQARKAFLLNWITKRQIMENYNSITGEGCDGSSGSSVPFYHWGALNALVSLDARGKLPQSLEGILRA